LTLPYTGTASSSSPAMKVEQQGSGIGGWFLVTNATSTENALYAGNNSTNPTAAAVRAIAEVGSAVEAVNNSTSTPTLYAYNTNTGPVATFGNSSSSSGNIVSITKSGGTGKGLNISYAGSSNAVYIDNNSTGTGLELRQDGTGKAAYFHIESTTSAENALLVESKSTSSSSDAVQASAVGGRAFFGTSAGANTTTMHVTNSGGGRAIYGQSSSTTNPALTAYNSNATANVKVLTANSSLGEVFVIDREGDVAADGSMNADSYVATETRSSAPEKGGVYKNNVIHAWALVSTSGSLQESFGVASVTKLGTGQYQVTLQQLFPGSSSFGAVVTPFWPGPAYAVLNSRGYSGGQSNVIIHTYNTSGTLTDMAFTVIIVGQY
jgi:hypothetical protein